MQSFSRVTSGLMVAQVGLYTTGHNISNASTDGYTRQRANFADSAYNSIGSNGSGPLKMGLGSKLVSITQLRDDLLDKTYRNAVSKSSYHNINSAAVEEIENILGELYGDARLGDSIDGLWAAVQELATHPDGMETRSMFVQKAIAFLTKSNQIADDLYKYQNTLNGEVIKTVNRINEITTQIEDLNRKIVLNESCGDNANDYRDMRNNLIDELATYGDIEVSENATGRVTILMEGKDLVANGSATLLGLRYTSPGCPFVEPVFNSNYVKDGRILNANEHARALYTNLGTARIGSSYDNDYGSLRALLLTRGPGTANYMSAENDVKNYTIPKFQRELDTLFNKIVTLLNDTLAPKDYDPDKAPYDLSDPPEQFVELFSRKYVDRYSYDSGAGTYIYNAEDASDKYTLYSMGNVVINPDVLNNFNKLCLSLSGDVGDTTLVEKLVTAWKGGAEEYMPSFGIYGTPLTFDDFYKTMVTNLGEVGATSKLYIEAQEKIVADTIAAKQQISGVALDEELTEMMKFQHAYNGASKMINVMDSMLEEVIRLK